MKYGMTYFDYLEMQKFTIKVWAQLKYDMWTVFYRLRLVRLHQNIL